MKTEQELLRNKVNHLQTEDRLNEAKVWEDRENNLVIMGLQTYGISDANLVKKLFNKLKVSITDGEYSIKTIPSKKSHQPLIVKFKTVDIRNEVVKSRRAKKGK